MPQLGIHARLPPTPGARSIDAVDALFASWRRTSPLARRCIGILRESRHGDLRRWLAALRRLPAAAPSAVDYGARIRIGRQGDLPAAARDALEAALRDLIPWRKGPFDLFGIDIDAEWRSERKWARIRPHLDLAGRRVLDVGCGNGYYGWRMLEAGARAVTGIDPSLLAVAQHAAVAYYAGDHRNLVLPLGLETLQATEPYDAVFSMGVVYHRRDPAQHVRDLARHTHADGVLVLESLVMADGPLAPEGRYARMRNVHLIPDVPLLRSWLADAGFGNARVACCAATTTAEQRPTAWMPGQSLAHALDGADPGRTVEGYPAPVRVAMIASRR